MLYSEGLDSIPVEVLPEMDQDQIILSLSFSRLGDSAKADMGEVRTDADKKRLKVAKSLFVSPQFEAIGRADAALRKEILRYALPGGTVLPSGSYWLPLALLGRTNLLLEQYRETRAGMVDGLFSPDLSTGSSPYLEEIELAREQLGPQFSRGDYPPIYEAKGRYGFVWRYLRYELPSQLPPELLAQEEEKFKAANQVALEECRKVLWDSFAMFVSRLVSRLTDKEAGKKTALRDSLIGNLTEFIEVFEPRNMAQDKSLADLIRQAKLALANCSSTESLKDSESLRAAVLRDFSRIEKLVAEELRPQAPRVISLEEEE